jgi:hypothetical protein
MSSRAVLCLALLQITASLHGADWASIAATSDRSEDSMLLQAMADGDLETRLAICGSLTKREDPYLEGILSWLADTRGVFDGPQRELLLRVVLRGFDAARVAANSQALASLLGRVDEWKDPQLTGTLIVLAPRMGSASPHAAIMRIGDRLVSELLESGGVLPSQETALGLDFLAAAEAVGSADFLPACAQIARLAREKALVDRARAVAAALLAR